MATLVFVLELHQRNMCIDFCYCVLKLDISKHYPCKNGMDYVHC